MSEIAEWAKSNENIFWMGDVPWIKEGVFLIPLNMPHVIGKVDRKKIKQLLKESGALIARWTTNWDVKKSSWWYTCCDQKDYDIASISSSRGKRGIKKGLKNCEVKRVSVDDFVGQAYPIYANALKSYGFTPPNEKEYRDELQSKAKFNGCEFWGAFVNKEMVAFSTCIVLDLSLIHI